MVLVVPSPIGYGVQKLAIAAGGDVAFALLHQLDRLEHDLGRRPVWAHQPRLPAPIRVSMMHTPPAAPASAVAFRIDIENPSLVASGAADPRSPHGCSHRMRSSARKWQLCGEHAAA
jgi:hypothetical protein